MRLGMAPRFTPRPSPLHAARAGASAALCLALALVAALYVHPLIVLVALVGIVGAGVAAGVGAQIAAAARLALPLALVVAAINPLLYAEGETLLVRGGTVLGRRFDITLEAVGYGALAGLRVAAFAIAFGLFSACVDPDRLLALMRRASYRSALAASLATGLVPVLSRDALRMGDAARCRASRPPRFAVLRATLSGALERAVDVAAALEVRGYSTAVTPPRERTPRSRHDRTVSGAAAVIVLAAIAGKLGGVGAVTAYPRIEVATAGPELALCCVILIAIALPFAGRRARLGIVRA